LFCLYCVLFCLYWVLFVLCFRIVLLCIFILYCFFYLYLFLFATSIRTAATQWQLKCNNNNNNNNNNNKLFFTHCPSIFQSILYFFLAKRVFSSQNVISFSFYYINRSAKLLTNAQIQLFTLFLIPFQNLSDKGLTVSMQMV